MVVMIKRQSPACTTLACNVQFFLWEKLVVSMQCVHRVLACSGVMVMAIVMVIGGFHLCLVLQIIRQQFPTLTTRRLGTRGQSK